MITDESHDGWRNFAAIHGLNVTALIEAFGMMLAQSEDPEEKLPPWLRATLQDARRIAAKRSARRRS